MSVSAVSWNQFCESFVRYEDLGLSLDYSRMSLTETFFEDMAPLAERALSEMKALEAGAIANPDENRMVGHYWLRNAELAPNKEIRDGILSDIAESKAFAAAVHNGEVRTAAGEKFTDLLVVGIGGSALGPQLVSEAVAPLKPPLALHFFDNTDPDGLSRTLARLGGRLATTLTVVISKSGGTAETRNGMLVAKAAYEDHGLDFAKHAVAVTGPGSKMDDHAIREGFIKRFPMQDWVGGRTSVMHTVGLVPAALQGIDIDAFLAGAAAADEKTRSLPVKQNISLVMALMWFSAGKGKGAKDMVILPYKDRLVLLSKYLQQLVMESLGKERDLDGRVVHQGIAVYGNKGSTDQHAYVQQLRDGVNNFFATFLEVRRAQDGQPLEVEPGVTCGDYLQGFLRGTRRALFENGRESLTLSIPEVTVRTLGMIIAIFERAVGFYAVLVNINAYHQPGVEAGKKAAGEFLKLLAAVKSGLAEEGESTAQALAAKLAVDPEDVWHCLNHLAANGAVSRTAGATPAEDVFTAGAGATAV
ncbi:MAG: glucose-6-phosphate isomerase [Verrucomicrobiaceae bacterium]|nr:MAG: glucose-6-phosphate isomerase [Verrucomicrobiaceae bacterium]